MTDAVLIQKMFSMHCLSRNDQ